MAVRTASARSLRDVTPASDQVDLGRNGRRTVLATIVAAPDGQRTAGRPAGVEEISVRLSGNARGVYLVSWRSVSLLDGHSLSGSFEFGVGVTVRSGATGFSSSPRITDLAISIARSIEDLALILAVGLLLFGRLARRSPALGWIRAPVP